MVSLNEPKTELGPNVMLSACKSQNNALIWAPLRCGPVVIPAPPPAARFGTAVATPVHEALRRGFPLYLGAIRIVADGETTFVMFPAIPGDAVYMFSLMP